MSRFLIAIVLTIASVTSIAQTRSTSALTEERAGVATRVSPDAIRAAVTESGLSDTASRETAASTLNRFGVASQDIAIQSFNILRGDELTPLTAAVADERLTPSSLLVRETGTEVTVRQDPSGVQRFTLPITFRQLVDVGGTLQMLDYSPEVLPRTALHFDGGRGQYIATVGIGVFESNPQRERPIAESLRIALASTLLDSIDPGTLSFDILNQFQDIEVAASDVSDAPRLSLRPNFRSAGFDVPLPVGNRPVATFSFDRQSILGLGLETAEANLQTMNIDNPNGVAIRVSIDRGQIVGGGRVTLDRDGRATVTVRSIGFGTGTISSDDALFSSAVPATVSFGFPWLMSLAVLAGGIAGTAATKRSRKTFLRSAVSGVATGLIVVVAYAVGINLLGVQPSVTTGEALVFVLSALGAVAGPTVLKLKPG